jgi:hypothetical protein
MWQKDISQGVRNCDGEISAGKRSNRALDFREGENFLMDRRQS